MSSELHVLRNVTEGCALSFFTVNYVVEMVSFVCDACGQTVRKAQVEKHYQNECHNCNVLSCIDCGKDFHGDEYTGHTSCITEAEKYQGKLYKPKDKQNKGEHKQQEWLKQIREATKTDVVEPRLAALLDRISEYANIPRKKAKFQNFCRNSINVRDVTTLDKLWDIFSASSKQSPQQDETSCSSNGIHENGKSGPTSPREENVEANMCGEEIRDNEENRELEQKSEDCSNAKHSKKHKKGEKMKDNDIHEIGSEFKGRKNKKGLKENNEVNGQREYKKQKKKRRREDEEIDEPYTQAKVTKVERGDAKEQPYHFKWKSVIKAVLRQAPDQELPIKRLRKKVLAEFQAKGTNEKNLTDNELRAFFQKKVSSNPKFKVHKDRVRLVK